MAHTYRDIVYAILDETKTLSDDALLEVEHVIHICHKYRGLLFTQKYKGKKVEIPFAYYQRLNVYFDTNYSDGSIYQSFKQLPNILDTTNLWQYTFVHNDGMRTNNLNFINPQRFKNVGYSKWLRNQVYITIDLDNYMYAKSPGSNIDNATALVGEADVTTSEIKHTLISEDGLNQLAGEALGDSYVYYDTILDNPIEGYRFNGDNTLDPLDFIFPCEESLIQPIIDLCIKEIAAINGIPRDAINNATDDLSLPKQQN
jgi:hypothetical protein